MYGAPVAENVTFWLGPLNQTENVLADMFPSSNGFYVRPQPIDVSTFAVDQLPPMEARARSGLAVTNLLLNGLNPIEPITEKAKKFGDPLRVRRDDVIPEGEEESTTDDSRNQVELSLGYAQPLEWYAGFQPLLLTLPEGIVAKSLHWISLRDHKRHETVASVLLPNGPAFQIPGVVQLRGLSPNGVFNVFDVKTIEISDFVLRTGAKAVWFMIGKDILPNTNGHIVPLYDPELKLFDCDSLRDYHNETVHLRLPGNLDIKDVFWFSVFSMVDAVSYSHIYMPFNDMQLPPNLNGVPRVISDSTPVSFENLGKACPRFKQQLVIGCNQTTFAFASRSERVDKTLNRRFLCGVSQPSDDSPSLEPTGLRVDVFAQTQRTQIPVRTRLRQRPPCADRRLTTLNRHEPKRLTESHKHNGPATVFSKLFMERACFYDGTAIGAGAVIGFTNH
ncbi:hypothetical protein TELCIR_02785 [Teladorsagia circumcincta]|uniref:DM13 domain-containing protein n=1 Tax=Teladorsagia circumcincta TaxID=45464 RepID=A0A2G9UYF4_TELCI|nr:hypothetical protein TELCIR_02785 [Teladorsagia circumcincta]